MTRRWRIVIVLGVVAILSGGWLLSNVRQQNGLHGPALLDTVLQYIGQYYVDSIPSDSIYRMAASGAVKQLSDPYSVLETATDYRALNEATSGNYGGLGMQIDVRGGWIIVVSPLPQTPAERAGIQAGDEIVEVDGHSTQGVSQDEAVKVLRGDAGTHVQLKIRRPGIATLIPFSLVREKIHSRSTQPGTMLSNQIGYVLLTSVSDSSAAEVRREVDGLLKAGMKGLIIDLRANPGGLLTQGVSVSDLFLNPGQKIVETRGRMPEMNHQFTDTAPQVWPKLPVVVLVNEYSASAAEIIAGALQDNDRAAVVGTATFGKGLVQTLWNLGNGRGLKLTTGRWYTPSGRTIQRTAKDQQDQIRLANAEATRTDTTWLDSLPTYHSVDGRILKGGGGIVPDRIVREDTLRQDERDFLKAIGSDVAIFRDALVAEALSLKQAGTIRTQDFVVTEAMRQGVVDRMRKKGVELSPEELAAGRRIISEQLAYEIERYVFGRAAELRRRDQNDPQVQAALDLLAHASTPAALMAEVKGGPTIQ